MLFDRRSGGLPEITEPILATGRYVAIHEPSMNWVGYVRKAEAMAAVLSTVKGEDIAGILPVVETKPEKKKKAPAAPVEPAPEPPKAAIPPPILTSPSHACVRAGERPQGTEGQQVEKKDEKKPAGTGNDAFDFQRELHDEFPNHEILTEIRDGLRATRSFQQNGEVVECEDYNTRVKYLDMLIKLKIGTPLPRDKVQEPKKVTMGELQSIAKTPAGHRALQRMLDEAKAEMQKAATPPPAPPAQEVAKPS